ncbi:MAG TPA: hypothetical protein VIX86_12765 [Streptosporangiaceae bacterium]
MATIPERIDWFTTIPRDTVSVTAAGEELISLPVVPRGLLPAGTGRQAASHTGPAPARYDSGPAEA